MKLSTLEKLIIFDEVALFAGLSGRARLELARRANDERYPRDALATTRLRRDDRIFVVVSGLVRLEAEDRELARLRRGDCFGELGLLEDTPQRMLAVAVEASVCLAVHRHDLFGAAADDEAAHGVVDTLVRRLRARMAPRMALAATG